jgi:hypothetical protein
LEDVGMLYGAGFQVGFHGHIHRDSKHVLELLRDRFIAVSTGSLAVGPEQTALPRRQSILCRLHVSPYAAG